MLFRISRSILSTVLGYGSKTTVIRGVSTCQPNKPPYLMVASIANPEPKYKGTRHNVGSYILDRIVTQEWQEFKPFESHANLPHGIYSTSVETESKRANLFFFKSIYLFMNLQGRPIAETWSNFSRVQLAKYSPALVIIHDELQIPLGKIQIRRQNTSARGHNGLRSINESMGMGYTKIGIGIGKPKNTTHERGVADYVLSSFTQDELNYLASNVVPQVTSILDEMASGKHVFEVFDPQTDSKRKKS